MPIISIQSNVYIHRSQQNKRRIVEKLEDQVLVNLRQIIRATDLYSRELGRTTGLTTPQLVVCRAIEALGDPTVTHLSQEVHVSQATVTSVLNRLQAQGYVKRKKSNVDKRRVNVSLTTKGKSVIKDSPAPLQEGFVRKFNDLENWEQHALVSALARVAKMMNADEIDAAPLLIGGEPDK